MWRIRHILTGLHNFWYFRKEIWQFRNFDYTYQLRLWRKSLIPLRDCILNGSEVPEHRMKKFAAIQEAIVLLDHIINDEYMEMAEVKLGIEFSDNIPADEAMKVIRLSQDLATRDWKRLWRIFEGQNHAEYVMFLDRKSDPAEDVWAQWFDGTDVKGWWD